MLGNSQFTSIGTSTQLFLLMLYLAIQRHPVTDTCSVFSKTLRIYHRLRISTELFEPESPKHTSIIDQGKLRDILVLKITCRHKDTKVIS